MTVEHYKLEIYIPRTHFSQLQSALQSARAGVIGDYDSCLSVSEVTGYWRPLPGADPYDGEIGKLASAPEYKVEVRCDAALLSTTLNAIKAVHPYEEPVIYVLPLAGDIPLDAPMRSE